MSEKRFFTKVNKNGRNVIIDKECHIEIIDLTLACEILNRLDLKLKTYNEQLCEQQAIIISLKERNKQLRRRLEKINGGYGHLTHRNGLTANEWVIEGQERELKKKDEMISEFIERHSEDIVKIGEQQATIQSLKDENEQLRQQLKTICNTCCYDCEEKWCEK